MDTLWSKAGKLIGVPSENKVIACSEYPCPPAVSLSFAGELMLYQDSGSQLTVTLTGDCRPFQSVEELKPSWISVSLTPSFDYTGQNPLLVFQDSGDSLSFTDSSLWTVEGGRLVWRHDIRATNSCEPGNIELVFSYGPSETLTRTGLVDIPIGIGSVNGFADTLHIWGEEGLLTFTVQDVDSEWFSEPLVSVSAEVNNEPVALYDYLRLAEGPAPRYISFGTGWTVGPTSASWQEDIVAIHDKPETVNLKFKYGKMSVFTLPVKLEAGVSGRIGASPHYRKIGDYFDVWALVEGSGGKDIPRYPGPKSVSYAYVEGTDGTITTQGAGWSGNSYEMQVAGSVYGVIKATLRHTNWDSSESITTATFEIVPDAPIMNLSEPDSLHIYGDGKNLTITIDHLGDEFLFSYDSSRNRYFSMSFSAYDEGGSTVMESLGDVFSYYDSIADTWFPLSFSADRWTSGSEWVFQEAIRANSGTATRLASFEFQVWYYNENHQLKNISRSWSLVISDDLRVEASAPGSADQGSDFTVKVQAFSTNGENLPRLPGSVISTSHGPTDSSISTVFKDGMGDAVSFSGFDNGQVSRTGSVDKTCVYKFKFSYRGEEKKVLTVTIKPLGPFTVADLIRACNERAKNNNVSAYMDPATQITWDDRNALSSFIYAAVAPYAPPYECPGQTWHQDRFQQELQQAFTDVCKYYTRPGSSGIVTYSASVKHILLECSCFYNNAFHPQESRSEAIAHCKKRALSMKVRSGNVGSYRAGYVSHAPVEEDLGYLEPRWLAAQWGGVTQYTLLWTSGAYTTVGMDVKGEWKAVPFDDMVFTTHGHHMPPLQGGSYRINVPPGGGSGREVFGSLSPIHEPALTKYTYKPDDLNHYYHRWDGDTGGYAGVKNVRTELIEFHFHYRS
mgnify:CR=1 FL=1